MPGPLGEPLIAGEYTVTYNGVALGMMEGDAGLPTLESVSKGEAVDNTSIYGKSTLTHFYQGADWFAAYTCLSYSAASLAALWPFGTFAQMGIISRDMVSLAAAFVLTVVAGTPAVGSPNSLTAPKALLSVGFNTRLLFGPTLRKVPIRQSLYPTNLGGNVVGWLSTTALLFSCLGAILGGLIA